MNPDNGGAKRTFLDMNGYQWTVVLAAWLGWGFDIFDSILMNYVAPNAVPTLLGLQIGTPQAQSATLFWTGILTSLLLVGWAVGGIIFGKVADRIGRTKTLLITMLMYSVGTAACAFAPNIWVLVLFRIVSSLGIGGEWAAGAAMVAEVVPEKRRVEAGALLYTAASFGLFLATFVTYQVTGVHFTDPTTSWRYVFLFGLIPAAVAFFVRLFIKEPERWKKVGSEHRAKITELFSPQYRKLTISGFLMAVTALIAWWSGVRICSSTNTMPTSVNGSARSLPCWTAPTSRPMATANAAGSTPRSTSTTHQAVPRAASARARMRKKVHSFLARSRWSMRRRIPQLNRESRIVSRELRRELAAPVARIHDSRITIRRAGAGRPRTRGRRQRAARGR